MVEVCEGDLAHGPFRKKLTRYIEAEMKMIEVVWSLDS
jgi:hypothetical protein